MLTLFEKLQSAPALIPMLLEGQPFIEAQDELSCTQFMRKYGMPEKINTEVREIASLSIVNQFINRCLLPWLRHWILLILINYQ